MSYGFPIGRLRDMGAGIGTILGPTEMREYVVVSGRDGDDALISFATVDNLKAAGEHVKEHGPRSVAEHRMFGGLRWQAEA